MEEIARHCADQGDGPAVVLIADQQAARAVVRRRLQYSKRPCVLSATR